MSALQTLYDLRTGAGTGDVVRVVRTLADMDGHFADPEAYQAARDAHNPVVYEVFWSTVPEAEGEVPYCTTVIQPGVVGGEYFMTKGHFHSKRMTGEVYLGLSGSGLLLLMDEGGVLEVVNLNPGVAAYVTPGWAHRVVNVGREPCVFFAAYPGDAGHDYGSIAERGFSQVVLQGPVGPELLPSPRWHGGKAKP